MDAIGQIAGRLDALAALVRQAPPSAALREAFAALRLDEIAGSSRLAGARLDLTEVRALLDRGRALGGHRFEDYLIVRGYADAAGWAAQQGDAPQPGDDRGPAHAAPAGRARHQPTTPGPGGRGRSRRSPTARSRRPTGSCRSRRRPTSAGSRSAPTTRRRSRSRAPSRAWSACSRSRTATAASRGWSRTCSHTAAGCRRSSSTRAPAARTRPRCAPRSPVTQRRWRALSDMRWDAGSSGCATRSNRSTSFTRSLRSPGRAAPTGSTKRRSEGGCAWCAATAGSTRPRRGSPRTATQPSSETA